MRVGSEHHAAKVTEDDVRRMRQAHAAGKPIDDIWVEIGRPLGVGRATVEKIVYRISWKHVE